MNDAFIRTKLDILKRAKLRLEIELEAIETKISELEEEQSILIETYFDDALESLQKLSITAEVK